MSIFKCGTIEVKAAPEKPKGRLAIIVGHEKAAQGADGKFPKGAMSEYAFHTKVVVPLMEKECERIGLDCKVFLRDGLGISGVGNAVSMWADSTTVAIELHFNSALGAVGTETLYDSFPKENKKFASLVQEAMCRALGRVGKPGNRGLKLTDHGRGAGNLTAVKCVGCLVEPAFCDNKEEAALLWNRREQYAVALVQAAQDHLST